MKTAPCTRCGADGVHIGETPLPDGNGAYDQYRCLKCGHGFMLPERPGAAPLPKTPRRDTPNSRGVI